MSLQGKVLETKGERLKVHLDIDQAQDPATAYAYPWVPTSGNMMYCMPQVGTKVVLYFPNEDEAEARVTGCVRTNGGECEATGDPNNRYFATEHGKQLALKPAELSLAATGNEASPLRLALVDDAGIVFENPKKLQLFAKDRIEFTSDKRITLESVKMFNAGKADFSTGRPAYQSMFWMNYEVNFVSPTVRIEASAREALANDSGKKFSDLKLGLGVLAGLVAVAAVTVAILAAPVALAAVGVTLAVSSVTVSAVAFGFAAGGGIAVLAMGYSGLKERQNADSAWEYVTKGLAGGVGGAISSFAGGPLSNMALNAIGGGAGTFLEAGMNMFWLKKKVDSNELLTDAYYSTVGGFIGGGATSAVTRGFQRSIGKTLAKQTGKGTVAFMRQYGDKFAKNVVRYNKTFGNLGKIKGTVDPNITLAQARKSWEAKMVEAVTDGSEKTMNKVAKFGFKEAAEEGGANVGSRSFGPGFNKGFAKQVQNNPDFFIDMAMQTENAFKRMLPDLVGNTVSEYEGQSIKANDKADQQRHDALKETNSRKNPNNSLLVKGATLKCNCGSKESPAGLAMSHGIYVTGIPTLTACNKKAMENVMDFGSCKKMNNNPCVPKIAGEWNQAKNDLIINDNPAVTIDSWLICSKGGQIKVKESGQITK